ncbi:all-trans retinoic acid-induced differentiation factor [Syngnathoides biaculeatus]|uniref:all-trans retinoic acid-induced differentiation factor n=1 Tax=Syngnathoides biaculeatus TaxID=300417 RepID=UPI002ADDF7D0|nr:all-trans retinoic acid-induced differentiation factor [Syngnathoides biaculeatus]
MPRSVLSIGRVLAQTISSHPGWLNQHSIYVCKRCSGPVLNASAVGQFCSSSGCRVAGRCCLGNETLGLERIIGLDLSNCSLTHVENLQEASAAFIVDLSLNSILNTSDSAFQGFRKLSHLILPADVSCPGGNSSWETVDLEGGNRHCRGQTSPCDRPAGRTPVKCPEDSRCGPNGPGFFECRCADDRHGYKCLREGDFPAAQVLGSLAASTLALSLLLWFTQRRKAKSL